MENDTAHQLDEFPNFPWEKLDEDWFKHCGGYGRGGIIAGVDFNNPFSRPHISFVAADISCDCWEIPMQLMKLLDEKFQQGEEHRASQIRQLISPRW